MNGLSFAAVAVFVVAVFPGLVSTAVYRLLMPARATEWGNAAIQGVFYSTVNAALCLPILMFIVSGHDPADELWRYALGFVIVFLVGPVVWPLLLIAAFKSEWLARRIQIPYPTAWDFLFDKREPMFALVRLNNGALIGGYYGGNSYAGSFPNDGDIYIEAVYEVDAAGGFGDPFPCTRGIVLRKDQYSYIEFFGVPVNTGEVGNGEEEQRAEGNQEGRVPAPQ